MHLSIHACLHTPLILSLLSTHGIKSNQTKPQQALYQQYAPFLAIGGVLLVVLYLKFAW